MDYDNVADLVREAEKNYISGTSNNISKYVSFNMYENIERIDAYLNSKHISGDTDALDRPKPFFNIVTAAVNIWYRATDIDRRNIRIKADKRERIAAAFIATIHLQEFMKRENFGAFLNEWGRALARYGSSVTKWVEKDGRLIPSVVPWNRLIVDPVDFDNNLKIEKIYLTPSQLRKREGYDQDMVEALLSAREARENLSGQKQDNRSDFIEVYEVHGELPRALLKDEPTDKDWEEYVQQMHVISYVAKQPPKRRSKNQKTEYDDFTLIKGKEKKDPYMITHLIEEDGRTQSIGAVEHLFDAQWMMNHSMKAMKDQLDLASKLIFQTSDGNFIGQNALTAIESGDILVYEPNQPLTQINNGTHDIASLQAFAMQWKNQAQEITSTPDAIGGNNFPSGTAYRQVAILNQEAHSLFEIMTENKAMHIEEMMRRFVIPFIKTKMNTTEEITATLDAQGITQFDAMYVPAEVTKRAKKKLISQLVNSEPVGVDVNEEERIVREELVQQGMQRFIKPSDIPQKTWDEVLKDLEWEVEVEIVNENSDKDAVMTTLTTVLQTVAQNPMVLNDPNMKMLFNKILETAGAVSPIELINTPAPTAPPAQPNIAPQPTPATPVGGV